VSLGHAAFFGAGCYAAALFAKHVMHDPLCGLVGRCGGGAVVGAATSPLVLRGTDLTRLMVTLGVASILYELANRFDRVTGGADGLQGVVIGRCSAVRVRPRREGGLSVQPDDAVLLFLLARRVAHSPFGYSLQAIRDNRCARRHDRHRREPRLAAVYTIAAAIAGVAGALLAQTTGFASLDVLDFHRSADVMLVLVIGGTGYLYGGLIGAVVSADEGPAVRSDAAVLAVLGGLVLVIIVLVGHERIVRPWHASTDRFTRRANAPAPRLRSECRAGDARFASASAASSRPTTCAFARARARATR
jgi:branched-chain amino acid transport system permease protein